MRQLRDELDPEMRAVIDAARGGHEPNELNRARVRKGVELKLAAGIALAVGPATSALAGALKITTAVVAVGAVVGAGVYALPRHAPPPARAPAAKVAAPATAPVVAPPVAEPVVEAPAPAVSPPRAAKRRAVQRPAIVESPASLKEETALLGAANAALGRGDVARALAVLKEYDERPGSPLLAEERAVTGILASCAAGETERARTEARRFHARWPRSPLAARVDAACVGKP